MAGSWACSSSDPGKIDFRPREVTSDASVGASPAPSASTDAGGVTPPPSTDAGVDSGAKSDASTAAPRTCVVCVHAGGDTYTAPATGFLYQADTGANGGQTASAQNPIANTNDGALYMTERYGDFTYTFQVPNGSYTVNLDFAEIYWTAAGQRVFNVSLQGQQVLANYDIVQDVGAANYATTKTFPITVVDGTVTIAFTSIVDEAKVSAIEIVK